LPCFFLRFSPLPAGGGRERGEGPGVRCLLRYSQPVDPYVGVSGFTADWQVSDLLRSVPDRVAGRRIMIGVLVSERTLHGRAEPRGANRLPAVDQIAGIFADHPLALNAIHLYAPGEAPLAASLRAVTELAGPRLHALQLNAAWPPPAALRAYREEVSSVGLVLQIGKAAIAAVKGSPESLARRLTDYAGLADAILLDPSGGRGIPFDTGMAGTFLEAIRAAHPGLGLGVAGGLGPETLDLVAPLAGRFPGLSIDAEGRLRDAGDRFVPARAAEYVRRALAILEPGSGGRSGTSPAC